MNTKKQRYLIYCLLPIFIIAMIINFGFLKPTKPITARAAAGDFYYNNTMDENHGYYFKVRNNINNNTVTIGPGITGRASGDQTITYYTLDFPFLFSISGYDYAGYDTNLRIANNVSDELGNVSDGLTYRSGGTLTKDDCYITLNFVPSTPGVVSDYNYRIEYLSRYKNTPFAEKKVKIFSLGEVALTTDGEVKAALGVNSMDIVLGSKVSIKFVKWDIVIEGNTKKYTAVYETVKFRTIDYNGDYIDWDLSLKSYSDYTKAHLGSSEGLDRPLNSLKSFTLLDLNNGDKKWFNTSQDISHDNLYGYFFNATFDITKADRKTITEFANYHFRKTTYEGSIVFYRIESIIKTKWYHHFWSTSGKQFMTYLLYLDGTSETPYIAENGAKDINDLDGAAKNALQDSSLYKAWAALKKGVKISLGIGFSIILGLIIYAIVLKVKAMKSKNAIDLKKGGKKNSKNRQGK